MLRSGHFRTCGLSLSSSGGRKGILGSLPSPVLSGGVDECSWSITTARRPAKSPGTRLECNDGQKGNQFSEVDCQFPILGCRRWRCLAGRPFTLCLESLLRLSVQFPNGSSSHTH